MERERKVNKGKEKRKSREEKIKRWERKRKRRDKV